MMGIGNSLECGCMTFMYTGSITASANIIDWFTLDFWMLGEENVLCEVKIAKDWLRTPGLSKKNVDLFWLHEGPDVDEEMHGVKVLFWDPDAQYKHREMV